MDLIAEGGNGESQTPRTPGQSSKDHSSKDRPLDVTVPVVPVNHNVQPEKFIGVNFKTWQQKMLFYLTTLNLARFFKEDPPTVGEDEIDAQTQSAVDAWKHAEFLCRNYILNGLSDSLYNVYSVKKTSKDLWESLEHKYKVEDAGAKKYLVGQFLNFKMVDSKPVISQVQQFQLILHELNAEGMLLIESFQVAVIIEKLPPAWTDFKNYLKHKRKEMSVEDLIRRLRIEEDNRGAEKRSSNVSAVRANWVEHEKDSKGKKPKPSSKMGPKVGISKKPRFQGKCFNCNKMGHKSSECRLPKRKGKEVNNVEVLSQEVNDLDLCAMISEINLIDTNPREWWLDSGATRHVCANKSAFSSLTEVENGEKVYMGNSATSDIKGHGTVYLKMTSGKIVKLQNVLYVPDIRRNLISGTLLSVHGFKMVFESQKIILSKNGVHVGKGYVKEGMWKMNVMAVKPNVNMNKTSTSSVYMLESSNLWHGRLGHVNYNTIRRLINLNHIPMFNIDSKHKCETCVEAKLTRSSFHTVDRNTKPLELIHSDICDLKFSQTRGGNKYFITFIDDSTKYCHVYLLKSKDEAIEKFILYKQEAEK